MNCIKKLILLCGMLPLFQVYAQPVNTNLSNGFLFDGEPYLVQNPTNSQNLVVAWMGLKLSGSQFRIAIKTRASFDGGASWSNAVSLPHFGNGYGSADVSMAFNKNGGLYLAYIDFRTNPDSGGVYVARSNDGGLNWDNPTKAFDIFEDGTKRPIDRPWLVVDNSTSSNSGTLYITTKPAPWIAPPNRNYFKSSSDSGHTWTPLANVDGGNYLVGNSIAAPMASPACSMNGKFCAAYPSYVSSQNPLPAFYLAQSFDKGNTFNYSTMYSYLPGIPDTNLKNGYLLICHPNDSNKMVFVSPMNQSNDPNIVCLSSNTAGQNWMAPKRVNDDTLQLNKAQDMVWAAYNESGELVVTWRDRRSATASGFWNAGYEFYYATSSDNGLSFSTNKPLSAQFIAFDSILSTDGNDFMCNRYQHDTIYAVWGDTRNSKMNIYFSKTIASTNTSIEFLTLSSNSSEFSIYPNPTVSKINITGTKNLVNQTAHIYSSSGIKIQSFKIETLPQRVDVSNYSKGTYFLKINSTVHKFVLN